MTPGHHLLYVDTKIGEQVIRMDYLLYIPHGYSAGGNPDYAGRRQVACLEIGAHGGREQHRSDGSDREVQGWYLFQVAAPLRDVFEPRRRRRMADRSVVTRR